MSLERKWESRCPGFFKWFNEKRKKRSIEGVIERFQQLLETQENEEIRAIYNANSYSLATTYKSFQVDSVRWHSWDEETRENHIKKMRNYTPTPSHAFDKPSNARRKPSSITRKKMNSTQKC